MFGSTSARTHGRMRPPGSDRQACWPLGVPRALCAAPCVGQASCSDGLYRCMDRQACGRTWLQVVPTPQSQAVLHWHLYSASRGCWRAGRRRRQGIGQRGADVVRNAVAAAQQQQHLVCVCAAQAAAGAHPHGVLRERSGKRLLLRLKNDPLSGSSPPSATAIQSSAALAEPALVGNKSGGFWYRQRPHRPCLWAAPAQLGHHPASQVGDGVRQLAPQLSQLSWRRLLAGQRTAGTGVVGMGGMGGSGGGTTKR